MIEACYNAIPLLQMATIPVSVMVKPFRKAAVWNIGPEPTVQLTRLMKCMHSESNVHRHHQDQGLNVVYTVSQN